MEASAHPIQPDAPLPLPHPARGGEGKIAPLMDHGGIFALMDTSPTATTVAVDPRHVSYAHLMYALHAAAIVIGIFTAATIIGSFLFGIPSIIAVIMNYLRRSQVRDTWLDSHFRWQLRTFWTALVALIVATLVFGPFALILIGIPFLLLSYFLIGVWVAYRVIRGWLGLKEGRTMPNKNF
jgi:uncharacterized membrane protein